MMVVSHGFSDLQEGWRTVRLKDVCDFKHGGTPSKANLAYWDGPIPWVSPKDMHGLMVSASADHISEEAVRNSSTRLVPEETLLIVVRSGILARTIPVALSTRPVAFNQDIRAVMPNRSIVDPWFLLWALKRLEPHILSHGVKKGATVHSMRSGFMEGLVLPVPSLPEQRRIVAILKEQMAAVDKARAATEALLKAAQALPAALLRRAFAGEL